MRGATSAGALETTRWLISIHAPREGCDSHIITPNDYDIDISIHAPREGCDELVDRPLEVLDGISIHAPREGCDMKKLLILDTISSFQSTHPVRGATTEEVSAITRSLFQSTHPVRGATRLAGNT